jgi:hypothetical protein
MSEKCGTHAGYKWHKNHDTPACNPCLAAAARYQRLRSYDQAWGRPRLVDPTGALRRVRALHRLGWTQSEIARRLGMPEGNLAYLAHRKQIRRTLHDRVVAVYDELSMTRGPSVRARMWAERHDWPPPLGWDDDTIDDPKARPKVNPRVEVYRFVDEIAVGEAMAGRRVDLTKWERREVVRRLVEQGANASQVADRLHILPDAAQKLISRTRTRDGGWSDLCPRGHDYNDPAVFGQDSQSRYCRACRREKAVA